jgi:hypothetical protein
VIRTFGEMELAEKKFIQPSQGKQQINWIEFSERQIMERIKINIPLQFNFSTTLKIRITD